MYVMHSCSVACYMFDLYDDFNAWCFTLEIKCVSHFVVVVDCDSGCPSIKWEHSTIMIGFYVLKPTRFNKKKKDSSSGTIFMKLQKHVLIG